MALLNPYSLKYDSRPVRVFKSTREPVLELSLQKLDAPSIYKVAKLHSEMIAKYIDGEDGFPPVLFPPTYSGERPEISPDLFRDAATVCVMQAGEETYDVEGLCHIAAALSSQWMELIAFVRQLNSDEANTEGPEPEKKEAPPTSQECTTDTLSPSASTSSETIPN